MGVPARNLPIAWDDGTDDDESDGPLLQRWIEHPDGRVEFVERPLTPEDFLNPQLEDKVSQGKRHARFRRQLSDLLDRHFGPAAQVLEDVVHELGPGLPCPSPDVSVVPGVSAGDGEEASFSVTKEGVRPALILEIVSPSKRSIREVDEVDKVEVYSRAGVPEYLLVDLPRRGNGYRLGLKGYRLGADGRYRPLEPDARGHLLLLYSEEEEAQRKAEKVARQAAEAGREAERAARKAAEADRESERAARKAAEADRESERAARKAAEAGREAEEAARKATEAENDRLRAEIEQLRSQTRQES
jgi:Uma2 family endonuclease